MNKEAGPTGFIAAISNEGILELLDIDRTESGPILTLSHTGTLTIYGPEGQVLRVYEEHEVEARQTEIDTEIIAAYDAAFGAGYGQYVVGAFALVGNSLEEMDNEPPPPPAKPATIN